MSDRDVFAKTADGQAEVAGKAHALPPRARSLLIMVDGKRSRAELRAMLGPAVDDALLLLQEKGLVRRLESAGAPSTRAVPPAPEPVAAPEPAAAPVPAPPPAVDWQQQRRDAAHAVTEALGPIGDDLALRLERCRDATELSTALTRAADMLDLAAPRAQAEAFRRRFLSG